MSDTVENIDVFACLDFLRDNSKKYAEAKARREYLEQWRKSKKALLMSERVGDAVNAQERHAYSHPEYIELLTEIAEAIKAEESYRWLMESAKLKVSVWQTIEATKRIEMKVL